jgi:hypothetical protein
MNAKSAKKGVGYATKNVYLVTHGRQTALQSHLLARLLM